VAPINANPKTGKWDWSATIDIDSAKMTEALAKALPKEAFVGKPYPLRNIKGRVHAEHGRVWVEQDSPLRTMQPPPPWDQAGENEMRHLRAD